jgi:hypothetical protein
VKKTRQNKDYSLNGVRCGGVLDRAHKNAGGKVSAGIFIGAKD